MVRHRPVVRWLSGRVYSVRGLLVAVAVGAALCLMSHFNLLYGAQLKGSDFFFGAASLFPPERPSDIVIVAIDDESLGQLGHLSSWSRSYHASVTDTLARSGARVIAFDILFSEPTPEDTELAASIESAGNVIIPVVYASVTHGFTTTGATIAFRDILEPLQTFEDSAAAVAHANVIPDEDGMVRRLPIVISDGAECTPALGLSVVATYLRRPQVLESAVDDNLLTFAGRSIPLDSSGNMLINYTCGSAGPVSFDTVSYADVLTGDVDADIFRDKIVLIGATAAGLGDTFWTPLGRMMSGVEVHAAAIHTILAADFLNPAPAAVTLVSIMALAVLCGLMARRFRIIWATVGCASLGAVYYLTAFAFFDTGVVLNTLYPPLAILGAFVGVNLHNIATERSEKAQITKTFGRYISSPVVDDVLAALRDGELKLGGEERQVTVLFADARGFTSMAETMPVATLVESLNRYLSVIIEAVLEHDGMVNKLGGDSIMAVWNAPIEFERHALLAVRAAASAQRAVANLQEAEPELPRMDFGIGINTGKAVAGNMGSEDRLEYSVVGDAVNTASRLTDAAPGRRIWIGSETLELVKGRTAVRPLPPLTVRGKREPVQAYEVIDSCDPKSGDQGSDTLLAAGQ